MNATEMEDVLKNLDRRLTNVEQILPTLTTKVDLKEALQAYPTKQDLKEALTAYATKDDLKVFATKEDLKQGLSDVREEMKELKRHAVMLFEQTQEQLEIIATHVADISQRLPRA
jgi:hypothetical protein